MSASGYQVFVVIPQSEASSEFLSFFVSSFWYLILDWRLVLIRLCVWYDWQNIFNNVANSGPMLFLGLITFVLHWLVLSHIDFLGVFCSVSDWGLSQLFLINIGVIFKWILCYLENYATYITKHKHWVVLFLIERVQDSKDMFWELSFGLVGSAVVINYPTRSMVSNRFARNEQIALIVPV